MNRRTWTLLTSLGLVLALGLLGGFVPVPFVALGPGPAYDTLGKDGPNPVIQVHGAPTYPTGGQLNMTTVSVTNHLTLLSALGLWVSGRYALAPREIYYPPNKSEQEIQQQNTQAFTDSQTSAETAALRYLKFPTKVVAAEVLADSPANRSHLQPGDQIVLANGKVVPNAQAVTDALTNTKPGETVEIRVRRTPGQQDGQQQPTQEISIPVQLAPHPHRPTQGFMGVSAAERPDVPFDIEISLADVGGPSAGLMFSLAIVDKLTPGELNGGQRIAGTGEIDDLGRVGPIGGIGFKMVKAHEEGVSAFLVPERNCAEAASHAKPGMQLVKVATLDDAVRALDEIRAGRQPASC